MVKYEYTGVGIMAFYVDDKRYEIGVHPRLKKEVELPRKLKDDELALIGGLRLVDEPKKKKEKESE